MPRKAAREPAAADLRRRAEQQLAQQAPQAPPDEAATQVLLHELQVHQIELEMQNEALQQSEAQAQDALQRVSELNDTMEQQIAQRTTELAAALEAAQAASRAKSAFLSNMSHELRTPMNGVIGMVELALRRATDAKQIDWLAKARSSAQHLMSVINDILDLAKIEAEQLRIDPVEFTLGPVLDLVKDLLMPEATRRGLELRVDIDAALARSPQRGDKLRLEQVLMNLVGNAVKFTEQGGVTVRVGIESESPGERVVRFDVKDSGIGIASIDQPRLFRAFQQVDDSTSRKYGGTGLGLVICAHMVQLMGGHIGLQSEPGAGSTFWFSVPLQVVAAASAPGAPSPSPFEPANLAVAGAGRRILLAEDDLINQEVLRELLESAGLAVDVATDGAEAVELARAMAYAVILMDLQLPTLNGFEAARAIRRLPAHGQTPIIALTASAFEQDRLRCAEAGMDDHIAKPVLPELLYGTVLKWLRPAQA